MASNFMLKRHRPEEKIDRKRECKRVLPSPPTEDLGYLNRPSEEDGQSDTEGDEESSGSEDQSSTDGEYDEIQGTTQESLPYLTKNTDPEKHSEEEDSDDWESDEEHELSTNGQSSAFASSSTSFSEHLSHKLSSEEVETLPNVNWKFKWEAPVIDMPNCIWKGTRPNFIDVAQSDATYGIKPKLLKHWRQLYEQMGKEDFDSSVRRRFFSICNSYLDILHSNKRPFYNGGRGEDSSHMDAYLMHSLNHIFRSTDLVKKNDCKIAKETLFDDPDRLRDRGWTRPKVLILLPLKSIAFRVVNRLIQLTPETQRVNVENHVRFNDEYGCEDKSDDGDGKPSKPCDWQALFGEGNNDDMFRLGIKHTGKSIKLYNDFYSSDMIIASPLGLVTAIGNYEENKKEDYDYLSSIEVLVIDHADVMSMQNWKHVITAVGKLNKKPHEPPGTDIMRIRQMYLDEHAQFYRQSIILSSYLTPEINSLFNHLCLNYKGKMKLECKYRGVIHDNISQVYEKFDADSMTQSYHARLEYFKQKIFPKIKESVQGGVMIFMNSSFELPELENFLKSQKASFCTVNEYSCNKDKSRARQEFFAGSKKIMLYTERAHFYWRYKIRGIKKIIIYSLPERKEFYTQIMSMLEESHDMDYSTVLFCPFDRFRLERIVGNAQAEKMISSERRTFIFR